MNFMAVRQFIAKRRVELHSTPCIVAHPMGWSDALIVPANEELIGPALPYFPIGGPVPRRPPPGATTSMWGGMEAGRGLLYSCQVTHLGFPASLVLVFAFTLCLLFLLFLYSVFVSYKLNFLCQPTAQNLVRAVK